MHLLPFPSPSPGCHRLGAAATGIPEVTGLCSLSLQLEEEHTHLFLHQLCGLHLRAGPDHIHHAHLQARPGELCHAASCRCTSRAGDASLATRSLHHARKK